MAPGVLELVPPGQGVQTPVLAKPYVPATQFIQLVEFAVPVVAVVFPAGQVEQTVLPVILAYEPIGQGVQAVRLLADAVNVPVGQEVQFPELFLKEPAAHVV